MSAAMTALVLASARRGPADPVAAAEGLGHKCLVDLAGRPMLDRVVTALAAARHIGRIFVSCEDPGLIDALPGGRTLAADGRLACVPAGPTLTDSVKAAAAAVCEPFPLLVTTGDNALHTPQIIDDFCAQSLASGADVTLGMTPAATLLAAYPDGARAFHRLADGAWSSCNIYALMTPEALATAQVFAGGGQFGKRPRRILAAFGLTALILYRFRLASLDALMARLGRRFGLAIAALRLDYAEAAIDVDNVSDLALTRKILAERCAQP